MSLRSPAATFFASSPQAPSRSLHAVTQGRQGDEAADLEALLESLGSDVVELVAAPRGLAVAVGEPVIYDVGEHSAIAPGVIVLAVAVRPGTPEATKLLLDAERAEVSAVIFKRGTDPAGLDQAAASAGVAVLSVPEEMTWTQLHGFLLHARRFSPQVDGNFQIASDHANWNRRAACLPSRLSATRRSTPRAAVRSSAGRFPTRPGCGSCTGACSRRTAC